MSPKSQSLSHLHVSYVEDLCAWFFLFIACAFGTMSAPGVKWLGDDKRSGLTETALVVVINFEAWTTNHHCYSPVLCAARGVRNVSFSMCVIIFVLNHLLNDQE